MTHQSTDGTQRIPQKVLTLIEEVDECEPLCGGELRAGAGGDRHMDGDQ
jgi:hypothetical protein